MGCEDVDWIELAQNKVKLLAFVKLWIS